MPNIFVFFKFLIFIILSFVLVHILALLGVFVAIAYPLWWLFSPNTIPCLICRRKKIGEYCSLCQEPVIDKSYVGTKNLRSVFLNSLIILLVSVISFGLVYVESKLLDHFGYSPVRKTVSFVIPSEGQYKVGEVFPMKIDINGVRQPINAVQADFSFDPTHIEVVDILTDNSFASIFIQKKIDNEIGYGRISGGLPNPGFFADEGLFSTVLLRGKIAGLSQIQFLPSSLVLANDGKGSNVLKDLASASYLILPADGPLDEKPDQSVVLYPVVLGTESEKNEGVQMKFFQEEDIRGAVLGATEDSQDVEEKKRPFLIELICTIVQAVASFILSFWKSIIDSVERLFQ